MYINLTWLMREEGMATKALGAMSTVVLHESWLGSKLLKGNFCPKLGALKYNMLHKKRLKGRYTESQKFLVSVLQVLIIADLCSAYHF